MPTPSRPPPPKPPPMPKGPPAKSSSSPSSSSAPSRPTSTKPADPDTEPTAKRSRKRSGKLRWLLGWVVTPLLLLGALFLAGVHVGARYPEMWLSRTTLWMLDHEPQLGPTTDADREPMARRIYLAVLPSKDHSLSLEVTEAELAAIAKAANLTPETLDCETVCRALWLEKNPELEFLRASTCKVTPPAEVKPPAKQGPATIECDAKVQREKK
jgi:hypothetical protein